MNICFNLFSHQSEFIFNKDILPFLDPYQKKILAIASLAFSFLAACYVIKHCCFKASLWDEELNSDDLSEEEIDQVDFNGEELEIDERLSKLAEAVKNKTELKPFPQLQAYWDNNEDLLHMRHQFVQVFSSDESPEYQKVREVFAQKVYRPLTLIAFRPLPVKWLSRKEIEAQFHLEFHKWADKALIPVCSQGFYFHSTTQENLESILKSGWLEVRARAFRGAFVSTKPTLFGSYILAFNRNIEHLSPLLNAYNAGDSGFWAGFSQDIPVNSTTLAFVLVDQNPVDEFLSLIGLNRELDHVRSRCKTLTGRDIKVFSKETFMQSWYPKIAQLEMGIPAIWPNHLYSS